MFRHEMSKLLTLRATWVWAMIVLALTAGVAALMSWAFTNPELAYTGDSLGLLQTIARSTAPSLYFGAILGVVGVRGDIRHGMTRLTLIREPRRHRVFAAKAAAILAVAMTACLMSAAVEVAVVAMIAGGLSPAGAIRALVVHTAVGALWTVVGVAAGTLLDGILPATLAVLAGPMVLEPVAGALMGPNRLAGWLPFRSGHTAYALIGGDLGSGEAAGSANPLPLLLLVAMLAVAALTHFRTSEV